MGVYNPHVPYILGEEWVGIRNEDVTFSPIINVQERGHTFTPTANRTVQEGHFYITSPPPSYVLGQQIGMAVYKTGTEAETGPVRMVTIPCNGVSITGSGFGGTLPITPLTFQDSGDGMFVSVDPQNNLNQKTMVLQFAALQYAQLLNGKRILKVQVVHQISWYRQNPGTLVLASDPPVFDSQAQSFGLVTSGVPTASASSVSYSPAVNFYGDGLNAMGIPQGFISEVPLSFRSFGENDPLWFTPPYSGNPTLGQFYPWRYQELARFDQAAGADRVGVRYEFGASSLYCGIYNVGYVALQVYFCEETRVAYGARQSSLQQTGTIVSYVDNTNSVTLRDTAFVTNPVLTAGQQYTVIVTSPDIGDIDGPVTSTGQASAIVNTYPSLGAVRELAASPIHAGVQVNVTQTPGQVFTKQTSHVLPQLSLHTSGGPLTEVHVYGRRAAAQVYGSITATQEILDGAAGGSFQFPQVRFFARRFGDTTIPLTLSSPTITGAGTTVSITPAQWDALTEIIDGWKQIDLRFTGTVTMGAGANPQWVWSSTGELPGNRWEVLGLYAPAVSATPGNPFNLVPTTQRLSTATYGQPTAGDTINMGWIPQYAPPVSATADDVTADAVLLFSQDMPTVTGLAVVSASQAVTGIGQLCGINPWFIPNAISYNRVTWAATSSAVPVTGFGYYELQRQDSLTPWQTIMYATSPTVTGFNDFEARASLSSDYRIRSVNSSLFAGQWSSTVSLTMAAPGITGTGMTADDHVVIFTSNSYQNGSKNLAYSLAWESAQPTEAFTFPEASFTQYQAMYNRNFFVAFRPTERGGEQWQRTILVQAAAIPPETLADFTSLRDMAWSSMPYVCIRDEDGNRWFSNVTVPTGRVMRDRKLYLADIGVVEVTDTAAPITVVSN
jgi:hypothetical protein